MPRSRRRCSQSLADDDAEGFGLLLGQRFVSVKRGTDPVDKVFFGIGFRQDSRFAELIQHVVIAMPGDKNDRIRDDLAAGDPAFRFMEISHANDT